MRLSLQFPSRAVQVCKRESIVGRSELADELGLLAFLIRGGQPGNEEFIVISELPEEAAAPVPHCLSSRKAGKKIKSLPEVAATTDVEDVSPLHPFLAEPLGADFGVLALEVTTHARFKEVGILAAQSDHNVDPGECRDRWATSLERVDPHEAFESSILEVASIEEHPGFGRAVDSDFGIESHPIGLGQPLEVLKLTERSGVVEKLLSALSSHEPPDPDQLEQVPLSVGKQEGVRLIPQRLIGLSDGEDVGREPAELSLASSGISQESPCITQRKRSPLAPLFGKLGALPEHRLKGDPRLISTDVAGEA
jgi:hypothetical protein